MKNLKDGWRSYRALLPTDAGETQLRETEQAFYGGCTHVLGLLIELGESNASESESVRVLEHWHHESLSRVREILDEAQKRWDASHD